jgi:Methyltransferase domain
MDARLQRRVQRYGWERAAGAYAQHWHGALAGLHGELLALAAPAPGEAVLDVACGGGVLSLAAARAVGSCGQVLGVDVAQAMVQAAAQRAQALGLAHARFERMDAEQLALPDAGFDVALCALGLMYVPDPDAALQRRARASRWPRPKNSGQTSLRTSASTMPNSGAQPQRARSPHTASAARPPGRSTRCSSRSAASGSGRYIRPSAHSARSKPASGSASSSASMRAKLACRRCWACARSAAARTIAPDRSTPSTRPRAPTACAAAIDTTPVPQATSSTCSLGAGDAAASSSACTPASALCQCCA